MKIKYSKQAEKTLKKMDRISRERIINAIKKLPHEDVDILKGYTDFFRLKIGSWRIIFETDLCENIEIRAIAPRGQVYNVLHESHVKYSCDTEEKGTKLNTKSQKQLLFLLTILSEEKQELLIDVAKGLIPEVEADAKEFEALAEAYADDIYYTEEEIRKRFDL